MVKKKDGRSEINSGLIVEDLVSVIIPVKEINDYLRLETIPAILKQSYPNFEIIILPDRPSKEKFAKTKITSTWPKTGPAEKRDIGAALAKGKILAFLDDDSYPAQNWLINAMKVFTQGIAGLSDCNTVTGVGGPSLTPPADNARQKASGYVWSTALGSGGAGTYRCAAAKERIVDDFPTVNLLIQKADFVKAGGFDCSFYPGEDTKLCLEITKNLRKNIIYTPEVVVYHHRREVFLPHLKQISRYAIHRGYFARKFPETSFRIGYFVPSLFTLGLFIGPILIMLTIHQTYYIRLGLILTYALALAIYFVMLTATSFTVFKKEKNLNVAGLLIPTIIMTHLVYGFLFIYGFFLPKLRQ
jgi:glycosyltransferase involved in cell wall biosynthesis